jgi:hypothetical protein
MLTVSFSSARLCHTMFLPMRITATIGLVLAWMSLIASGTSRQLKSQAPQDNGATLSVRELNYIYTASYPSLKKIDFRNFSIHFGGNPAGVALKRGKYTDNDLHNLLFYEVGLDEVHYLMPPNGSGAEYVLLLLYENDGGGVFNHEGIIQVLEWSNQQLRIVQEIRVDENHDGAHPNHPFNDRTKTLVLYSAHHLPGDAHCCVSAVDVLTFKWNGSRFVQTSIGTELTESGRLEGKKLSP